MTIKEKMKNDICEIYPKFDKFLIWEKNNVLATSQSIYKEQYGMETENLMSQVILEGLFFRGLNNIKPYGIGTDKSIVHYYVIAKILSCLKEV